MVKYDKTVELYDNFSLLMEKAGLDQHLTGRSSAVLFHDLRDLFHPPTARSEKEVLQSFFESAAEILRNWNPNEPITMDKILAAAKFESATRSDKIHIHNWMMENQLITHHPTKGEYWTRRITDASKETVKDKVDEEPVED
jgi:hypothetical protein